MRYVNDQRTVHNVSSGVLRRATVAAMALILGDSPLDTWSSCWL